jgi:hypothetical protein
MRLMLRAGLADAFISLAACACLCGAAVPLHKKWILELTVRISKRKLNKFL